ncbi:MAG: MBL fold metallo-hydrolase [Proteobacteria bacterium]|nr:MBL fold metallo-hydrolase [Pseudomonadota bacterium]MBU1647928.1 MBL fold metallo-hydrolase [Pseudomonadota bacterium]MBU1985728.1 MBL fold metallo-hydrolase [Pseudomonadota bacterium]
MKIKLVLIILMMLFGTLTASAQERVRSDIVKTSAGNLELTFIGHGSLMMTIGGRIIHFDPYSRMADYTKLPQADLIFLTHDHPDHLDQVALQIVRTADTVVILPPVCADRVPGGTVVNNGAALMVFGIKVEVIPAYNIVHKRDNGQEFHPKGVGNGYVLTFGDKRISVAGDTENIPEMKALQDIYCAFLPMNLPYTMTPEMVADAAKAFKPKLLYPYHYGDTDPTRLTALLKDTPDIEVRIRPMQ